jgi:hypothetical protein
MKKWWPVLSSLILFILSFFCVSASVCDSAGRVCSVSRDCCDNFLCINSRCVACAANVGSNCAMGELGAKKCFVGATGLGKTVNEVRECRLNAYSVMTNCYQWLQVEDCSTGLKGCQDVGGVAQCACLASNVCAANARRCKEVNSLPISPKGPDEIQQCNSDGCGWTTVQSCGMGQDCVNNVCVDRQCPYCCPAGRVCSNADYGVGCASGSCCLAESYCKALGPACASPNVCKPNGCSTYQGCSAVASQSCSGANNCCSGSCTGTPLPPQTPPSDSIGLEDFRAVLVSSIADYLAQNSTLVESELKDLLWAYLYASTSFVNLHQQCPNSGLMLDDIYSKALGTPTQPSHPQPAGDPLPFGSYAYLDIAAGSSKVYTATVPENKKSLQLDIYGLAPGTNANYSWIFPDGTEFPAYFGFNNKIEGTNIGGNLGLRSQSVNYSPNIPYQYIPAGNHTLIITAIYPSYMQIWLR